MKGKYPYSAPPCTIQYKLAAFEEISIIYLFNKTNYLKEEVSCTELSLSIKGSLSKYIYKFTLQAVAFLIYFTMAVIYFTTQVLEIGRMRG